jgi:hypothetical protein
MITQRVRVVKDIPTNVVFKNESVFSGLELYEYSTLPAWIVDASFEPYVELLIITAPTLGTFTYQFTLNGSPAIADATLIIEVVDSLTDTIDTCYNDKSICLVWLNREGGRQSFIFDERKNFGMSLTDAKTFVTNKTIKYSNRGKIFNNKTVYKTGLTNEQTDYLDSLRYAIQAWEYDYINDISTPISVDVNSFEKYNTKDKLNEFVLKYRIANYKEVQKQ